MAQSETLASITIFDWVTHIGIAITSLRQIYDERNGIMRWYSSTTSLPTIHLN